MRIIPEVEFATGGTNCDTTAGE